MAKSNKYNVPTKYKKAQRSLGKASSGIGKDTRKFKKMSRKFPLWLKVLFFPFFLAAGIFNFLGRFSTGSRK